MAPRSVILAVVSALILGMSGTVGHAQPVGGGVPKPLSPDEPKDSQQKVRIIELPEGSVTTEPLRVFIGHTARVGNLAFFPGGDRLLSVSNDGTVRVWDVATGKPLRQFKIEKSHGKAALSADGRFVAVSAARKVVLLELKSEEANPVPIREFEQADTGFIGDLAFSPDGRQLASANYDFSAILWDTGTGKVVQRLQGNQNQLRSVAFNPSGTRIVTGGYDKMVRIWDPNSGKPIRVLRGHEKPILSVAISPDGTQILSAGFDKVIKLWDFESGREIRAFRGHTEAIHSVAFSADGRLALTASEDHSARLWDVATGEELHRFLGHSDYVLDAVFSPDGRTIATSSGGDTKDGKWIAGEDYAIRLWRMPKFETRNGH
jgi:WD40 repeat protein